MNIGEWVRVPAGLSLDQCPPHLRLAPGRACRARQNGHGFACTRRAGHTGRHAAGTGTRIVAVWR